MAPLNSGVSSYLRQLIYYHIDHNLLKNALFFAERLLAHEPRATESVYLLTLCYLQLGDYATAYEYSKSAGMKGTHPGCIYVFGQASLALKRYGDGIKALEKSRGIWTLKSGVDQHSQLMRYTSPDPAAMHCLLGKLYLGLEDRRKATAHFEESLKLNPFMWDAFTNLCDMGVHMRVHNVFRITSEMEIGLKATLQESTDKQKMTRDTFQSASIDVGQQRPSLRHVAVVPDLPDPFSAPIRTFGGSLFGSLGLSPKLNESTPNFTTHIPTEPGLGSHDGIETPTAPSTTFENATSAGRSVDLVANSSLEPPQAPIRRKQGFGGIDFNVEVPRLTRGISTRRNQVIPEVAEDASVGHAFRSTAYASERKRTISGQVIPRRSDDPGAPQRRSVRLINQFRPTSNKLAGTFQAAALSNGRELKKARQPITRIIRPGSGLSTAGRQVSGNRKPAEDAVEGDQKDQSSTRNSNPIMSQASSNLPYNAPDIDSTRQREAIKSILELCKKLGNGYFALSRYQCGTALQYYDSLPVSQQDTPWVLAQMGRAHYEQAAYVEAEGFYKRLRQITPTRCEDLEIYSTILWFLKRETDLAFLAHELIEASWQSPQAWCAIGNSWSLARDHEQALKAFRRATQLNDHMAYAYTLQGHEHVENEEYDKALTCYLQATCADKKHYNAYYGLGRVYERLGNYEKALKYFSTAVSINPTNAVLICCIGTILMKQGHKRQALKYFTQASELAPKSVENRLRKAKALKALGGTEDALRELNILKDVAPDDSRVHYMLGELYKAVKDKSKAIRHYTIALNLDPKVCKKIQI